MKTFIAIHRHKYGTSLFPFRCKKNVCQVMREGVAFEPGPLQEVIIESLGIDFEPDKDEELEIIELDDAKIPVVEIS